MMSKKYFNSRFVYVFITSFLWLAVTNQLLKAQSVLTPEDVLRTKSCGGLQISPDGEWIAYTVRVPRDVNDKAGSAMNLLRWMTARTIKETFDPPKDWHYPFMSEK